MVSMFRVVRYRLSRGETTDHEDGEDQDTGEGTLDHHMFHKLRT